MKKHGFSFAKATHRLNSITDKQQTGGNLNTIKKNILDFFYPPFCLLCSSYIDDQSEPWLCSQCLKRLKSKIRNRAPCPRCSVNTKIFSCECNIVWDFYIDRVFSVFDFDEELQKLAHLFKYKGFSKLIKFLGRFSAESIPDQFTDSDIAVPVPLHFRRKFARGFNQSLLLASGILEGLDMERKLSPGILKRIRYTKTQTKLNNTERIANIKGAFALNPEYAEVIKGKKITLFDDIATTLATGNECARVLIDNGAESVKLITLSHD